MKMSVGDKLWFINKTTKSVDFLVVAFVGRDVFSFRYNGKLFKCSKSYAEGKLFKSVSDISNLSTPPITPPTKSAKNRYASVACSNKGSTLCKPERCVCEYFKHISNMGSAPRGSRFIALEEFAPYYWKKNRK